MTVDSAHEHAGRVAIVTGAAGPMGFAVSREMAARGALVVMVDRNAAALEARTAELAGVSGISGTAVAHVLDVTDEAAIDNLVADLEASHGAVSILINNAGILSNHRIAETDLAEWNRIMNVNLTGAYLMTRRVLPAMRARRYGRIVNTSSYAAQSGGVSAGFAYTVSKGGMLALTRAVAADTVADGITCNAIAPAWVRTPMVTEHLTPEEQRAIVAKIPVGRFSEPEEFAHAVLFLVSDTAGFITGETVNINGGARFA